MPIKGIFITAVKVLLLSIFSQGAIAYEQSEQGSLAGDHVTSIKTDLQDKHYRQALYHYFQGDNKQALSQIGKAKAKLSTLDSRSSLFEAGLQLSAGLLHQAKATLINFEDVLILEKESEKNAKKSAKANELRLISLLSLTEQYLQQGNIEQARGTLARIKSVSSTYYQQYHVLNQLAYWPNDITLLPINLEGNLRDSSPYIQLNDALRLIEQSRFEQAIVLLTHIKVNSIPESPSGFWKTLFLNESTLALESEVKKVAQLQGQAIQDYAQLLLAQIYISQQRYDFAFTELRGFPQHSPYAESALFLFAFTSQQVKQYDMAFNLLNLHYQQYPYSSLGWQSAQLMAQQVSEQQSLEQGVTAYQAVESYFILRQQSLNDFNSTFKVASDLLDFNSSVNRREQSQHNDYQVESVWLQQALYDAELSNLYQGLLSIDTQIMEVKSLLEKTTWLAEIISLNQQRKNKIITAKSTRNHQDVFEQLMLERDHLAKVLDQQAKNNDHSVFANDNEKKWLSRIKRGELALSAIANKKNTDEYKQRLARVKGVLSWDLATQYPQRTWQHNKQLQQIDSAIARVNVQRQRLNQISQQDNSFEANIKKHQQSISQLNVVLSKALELREKFSQKIRLKVKLYIDEQKAILAEHLLSTRQGMAKVLEQMESADKKLSIQLAPSLGQIQTDESTYIAGDQ